MQRWQFGTDSVRVGDGRDAPLYSVCFKKSGTADCQSNVLRRCSDRPGQVRHLWNVEPLRSMRRNTESDVSQDGVGLATPDNQLMRTRGQCPGLGCYVWGYGPSRYSEFESRSRRDMPNHRCGRLGVDIEEERIGTLAWAIHHA